ncbi:MAG TPA: S41 family peptidase [Thermoanaerobaculia bacterium]|nr:S41 family peptidase [Thermoanaerobaculia bacterium]
MQIDGPQSGATNASSPQFTPDELLREITNAAGPIKGLRELRDHLPTARSGHLPESKKPARKKTLGFGPEAALEIKGAAAAGPKPLTYDERETVIDQALILLQDLYAHLSLKRALHAVDPVQRLRLLRMRHRSLDERSFQTEMIEIFVSLRDLHTNYTLPSAYWPKFAFLPFRVEEYYENKERKYLVSWVSPVNPNKELVSGAEITHWNGAPIDLAVMRNAAREAGSNPEARRARGLEALTLRWLGASMPPDEDWVTLTYKAGGKEFESRFLWQVVEQSDLSKLLATNGSGQAAAALGLDVKTELLRRVRKCLFDGASIRKEREMASQRAAGAVPPIQDGANSVSLMPDVFPRFGPVTTPSGMFGYVRMATFVPPDGDVDGAVDEFVRIIRSLPPNGLILDVRGNGGGYINFGERILQTLTPQRITPEPFHFATTALTIKISQAVDWLSEWALPLQTALATGAAFSQGFPLTTADDCNDIGQVYQGPVVLITDAFCYSTTDIFSAGFQDHAIGKILGCHDNTGAGGANVWDYADLLQSLGITPAMFPPLPGGTGMRVAARRSTRVASQSGVPLEDLGVTPNERYYMTRADLLQHNVDLINRAAAILNGEGKQTLSLTAGAAPIDSVRVDCGGIDRVDLSVDGRPISSADVSAGSTTIPLPHPVAAGSELVALGFRAGVLVVSARRMV